MIKAAKNGQTLGEYSYDGDGVRAKKIEAGQTLLYLYRGFDVVYEKTVGSDAVKHLLAGGLRIVKMTLTGPVYYHLDHLCSTRLMTDVTGQSTFERNFKPFGSDYGGYGSDAFRYTGRPYDSATGLYYFLARYYDPEIGRFTIRDALRGNLGVPQSLNRYAYVLNNPLRHTDPGGALDPITAAMLQLVAEMAFVGFVIGFLAEIAAQRLAGQELNLKKATGAGAGAAVGVVLSVADAFVGFVGPGVTQDLLMSAGPSSEPVSKMVEKGITQALDWCASEIVDPIVNELMELADQLLSVVADFVQELVTELTEIAVEIKSLLDNISSSLQDMWDALMTADPNYVPDPITQGYYLI